MCIPEILLPNNFSIDSQSFQIGKEYLCIKLVDDYYNDTEEFFIPLTCLVNGTWQSYINGMVQAEKDKRNKQKEAKKAFKEQKELEEYQRLKEKFEKS